MEICPLLSKDVTTKYEKLDPMLFKREREITSGKLHPLLCKTVVTTAIKIHTLVTKYAVATYGKPHSLLFERC